MILFKACPKCGGDVYLDRDRDGNFAQCIQCSRSVDVTSSGDTEGNSTARGQAPNASPISPLATRYEPAGHGAFETP